CVPSFLHRQILRRHFGERRTGPTGLLQRYRCRAVCCRIQSEAGQRRLYIMTLGCLAPYRELGVGTKLLEYVFEICSRDKNIDNIFLHVQTSNEGALAFYKKFGFEIVDTAYNYYKRIVPPDAYVLQKNLVAQLKPSLIYVSRAIIMQPSLNGCEANRQPHSAGSYYNSNFNSASGGDEDCNFAKLYRAVRCGRLVASWSESELLALAPLLSWHRDRLNLAELLAACQPEANSLHFGHRRILMPSGTTLRWTWSGGVVDKCGLIGDFVSVVWPSAARQWRVRILRPAGPAGQDVA
uniref:N-terminal methionine N(alpha)-acetyltransferase NatE n=1 Tax=Macrostomum lignano TaxID=282301 RepID=A0A1I8FDS6_9PLAT